MLCSSHSTRHLPWDSVCMVRIKPLPHLSCCSMVCVGGRRQRNSPLQLVVSLSRPPSPPTPSPSWILSLWVPESLVQQQLLLCHHLYSHHRMFCASGKAHGGFAEISYINITVSTSKWMAVTVEKAQSSWKCRMVLTQPQMLWLAGIEVGRSLIWKYWWSKAKIF